MQMMFKVIVDGTNEPDESREVNQLHSAEREKTFVLNSGNTALVRTGIAADVPEGYVGLIFPASPEVNVMPKMIAPGFFSEIVLTVVNDASVAQWIEPGELLADMTITKVVDKSNAKRSKARGTKGRSSEGSSKQSDEGSSATS